MTQPENKAPADLVAPRFPIHDDYDAHPAAERTMTLLLTLNWYDRPNEPAGWHVELLAADTEGYRVAIDSEKVAFPVDVDRFQRHQRVALAAALLVAFPGAEIRELEVPGSRGAVAGAGATV